MSIFCSFKFSLIWFYHIGSHLLQSFPRLYYQSMVVGYQFKQKAVWNSVITSRAHMGQPYIIWKKKWSKNYIHVTHVLWMYRRVLYYAHWWYLKHVNYIQYNFWKAYAYTNMNVLCECKSSIFIKQGQGMWLTFKVCIFFKCQDKRKEPFLIETYKYIIIYIRMWACWEFIKNKSDNPDSGL